MIELSRVMFFIKHKGCDRNGNHKNEVRVVVMNPGLSELRSAGEKTKEYVPFGRYYARSCKAVTQWELWEIEKYCREHGYYYMYE